jgi:glycosyltransferase involved in cell wall biosynthesis
MTDADRAAACPERRASSTKRPVESCPHRARPRESGGGMVADCQLLGDLSGIDEDVRCPVRLDACDACCALDAPTSERINPVIASLLSRLSDDVVARGGVPGCDAGRAEALGAWARRFLRTEDGATAERRIPSVAIIIPCHNYARFLPEAIESALAQSIPPREIVVVDDASDDDTRQVAERYERAGVRYLRIEARSVYQARRAGMEATNSEVLCFLDADDVLAADYLEAGMPLFDRSQVGVVYSDVTYFGMQSDTRVYPDFDARALDRFNYMHAGSLVRRRALEISSAFAGDEPINTHADWFVWRRVVHAGWIGAKQAAIYRYRRHEDSMLVQATKENRSHFECACLGQEEITIFTPLSGRTHLWPSYRDWLLSQTWPRQKSRLVLMDTSNDPEFGRTVRRFLAESPFSDTRYIARKVAEPGLADQPRRSYASAVRLACAKIYNEMARLVETPFVLVVEDDIVPPPGVVERLLRAFDPWTAAVGAPYRSRFHPDYVAWNHQIRHLPEGDGVRVIGGCGFGCLMIRRACLSDETFAFGYQEPEDFDHAFCRRVFEKRLVIKMDWSQPCQHLSSSPASLAEGPSPYFEESRR